MPAVVSALGETGLDVLEVTSAAPDRATYLQRPDLGRELAEGTSLPGGSYDLALVVADGLSPRAVADHAAGTVAAVLERLAGWSVAPLVVATQARVALGDPVGRPSVPGSSSWSSGSGRACRRRTAWGST